MIEKLAVEGRIKKLNQDREEIKEYNKNVSPYIQSVLRNIKLEDGSNLSEYLVGYMWGTMGWVYDTATVSVDDVKSWKGPFNNPNLNKRATLKDSVRDSYLVGLAMAYEEELTAIVTSGVDVTKRVNEVLNNTSIEAIEKVGDTLSAVKPKLYGFEVDSGKNDIITGKIDVYVAWSGDAAYAIDVALGDVENDDGSFVENTKRLDYYIPDEGSNIWFDGMVIPSASTNDDACYKFMEFISRPENVAQNMNYIGYTSMVGSDVIYEDIVLDWFDEFEYYLEDNDYDLETLSDSDIETLYENTTELELNEYGYQTVDLSYFFTGAESGDYTVIVSDECYGRLMAQYPTLEMVNRCAVMSYFDSDELLSINEMWESVKGETFPLWLIILIFALIILLAVAIVLYRNREKIKWLKLPEFKKKSYAEKNNLKVVKKEKLY
jgi:spermidine/putrescine transport system substrate-binding protein